eukprot:2260874-Rhodomonas_salina.2
MSRFQAHGWYRRSSHRYKSCYLPMRSAALTNAIGLPEVFADGFNLRVLRVCFALSYHAMCGAFKARVLLRRPHALQCSVLTVASCCFQLLKVHRSQGRDVGSGGT